MAIVYKANDKFNSNLSQSYTVSDTTLYVDAVPDHVPTIIVADYGGVNETIFAVTDKTANSLTGVSRLRGANTNLDNGTTITCLNNEEFINQFETAVFNTESLKDLVYAADGGSTDAYAISLSPTPTDLDELIGVPITFKANTVNTGAATLNINSLGPIAIKKLHDQVLADGDIEVGQLVTVVYDGTNFQMQSQIANTPEAEAGGTAFWTDVPGTPVRVSDTQFTITDTANANLYDLLFKKGVILRWLESSTFQTAMVISSSYSSNAVTINIVGDSLTAGFTSMKYAIQMAQMETFIIAGTLGAATDIAKTWYLAQGAYILSADAYVKTAGTTNDTVFDINDDGTTLFTTKPTIATTATSDINNVSTNPSTEVAAASLITVDVDSVSTTAPIEAYIYLFWYPTSWRYRS